MGNAITPIEHGRKENAHTLNVYLVNWKFAKANGKHKCQQQLSSVYVGAFGCITMPLYMVYYIDQ